MNIYEIIQTRRSVRSFREDLISEETLKKILEAARLAPTAQNDQNFKLVIVQDKEKRQALAKAADQRFIAEAPVIIVAVSLDPDDVMDSDVPTYAMDLAIVLDHITLAAVEEKLGTCWIGAFSQEETKKVLDIPEKYKIAGMMPLGVPYDEPGVKTRKNIKQLISYDNFSE